MSIYDLAYFDIRISVGLWSVCCRSVIGLSSGLSVCCRLRVQHFANDRFSIGVMSVIYRSQIGRFHTESYPTWTRLVLRCLQQHCRWPTAGRFIENFVFYVGFVSVWPVWLGFNECFQCSIFVFTRECERCHYGDVIMSVIASQITSLAIVYSTVYSGADQRKHQSSASLAFVRGIHRGPVNSPHKWPVTRKMFLFDDVIM